MDADIRTVTSDELPAVVRAVEATWGHHADEEDVAEARSVAELDRTFVAFVDGTRPVGVASALSFDVTLPGGGTVPASGLTAAGVLPTHRRRGLFRALMDRYLQDSRDRDEPLSLLVAAEATIYGRFGYGAGTLAMAVEIDRARSSFGAQAARAAPGELRMVDADEASAILPAVYDGYRRAQPGEVSRSPAYWTFFFSDRERWREGASARFTVVHEPPAGGETDGYATYRMRTAWPGGLPDFGLVVEEVVTADDAVRSALWRFLLDVDLVQAVSAPNLSLDDPLRWLLADPRAMRVTAVRDLIWVRIVDVPAALAARRYATSGELVLDVADEGRIRLDGGPDGAACRPTPEQAPDLSLGPGDLGAIYLGGVAFSTLARAGRIDEHRPGAVADADALFRSDVLPHSVTDF